MINFDTLIDNYVYKKGKDKTEGRYYPSEVGSCMRKTWYSYKQPIELNADVRKVFEIGNILHSFITDVISSDKNDGVELVEAEAPFVINIDDFVISGRIDDIVKIKTDDKTILVEVKSTKMLSYIKEPSESYVMQLQLYMHSTGIKEGIILYIEKATLKTKIFEVNYDERLVNAIFERFKELHKCIKSNELPLPEAMRTKSMNWMCKYCDYADRCAKE